MDKYLGKYSSQIYALLRIVVGFLFACHGAQKLFGALGGQQVPLASLYGLAGIIELLGGLLILLGLFASWAAFIASELSGCRQRTSEASAFASAYGTPNGSPDSGSTLSRSS